MTFLQAFSGLLSLLLLVLTGYVLAAKGAFPPICAKRLPGFITNISLPPFLACTIISSFAEENLFQLLYGSLVPFILMLTLYVLAYAIGKICHVPERRFGLFCACVSNPNTIFIGIPVNMALFGESSVTYVLLYYFASTSFFWTIGNYFISRDQPQSNGPEESSNEKGGKLRKIVSMPIIGFLGGMLIVILGLPVPGFLFQWASLLGQLTTPLALIFIGITLQGIAWKKFRLERDMIMALFGRMVLSPLLMALLLKFISLPPLMGKVFIIQSSLPVLMQVAILSAYYRTDPQFGSIMVAISTALCIVTVPFYMSLL